MQRFDILLLLAIGFFLGTAFGIFFPFQSFDAIVLSTFFLLACGFSMYGKPFFVRVALASIAVSGGLWIGSQEFLYWDNLPELREAFHGTLSVTSPSVEKLFFQESEIQTEKCESDFCPHEKILLREAGSKKRRIGDRVVLTCDLKKPEEYIEIAGRSVAYRMILATRGIGYLCERPTSIDDVNRSDSWYFGSMRRLVSVKERLVTALEQSLPASEAALSLGMLIGADEGFSSIERDLFIRTGVTHVTAVSGYNITLVGGLLFFLAILFGWYRKGASFFAIIGIVSYVLLVGAPASAVRAGIMGSLLLLTLAIGRPGSAFRIWLLALVLMLALNPLLLRYDIGFELSYLATLALLLYAGVRDFFWMPKSWFMRILYEAMILSLFVEWLVVPVIILQFGTLSLVSLLTNTVLVLLVPCIMFFAFLSGLSGIIVNGGIFLFAWPTFFLAHLFMLGTRLADTLPGSFFSGISISFFWILLWYVVTGFLFWFFLWRKRDTLSEESRIKN